MLRRHGQPRLDVREARRVRCVPGHGRAAAVAPLERGPERDAVGIAQRLVRHIGFREPKLLALEHTDRAAQRRTPAPTVAWPCGALRRTAPQRLTTRSTSWLEIVQQGQLCGARCISVSTVLRMCAGELSLLSSSKLYAMCRRPGCVYSATVAVESSEEISPSATTSGILVEQPRACLRGRAASRAACCCSDAIGSRTDSRP